MYGKFNLELLAQIVGAQLGLTVNVGNGFAIGKDANGRLAMTVPSMALGSDEDAAILRSGICHEAVGHGRHTDFDAQRGPTELHRAIENILEDARIEKAAWKIYPKTRKMLDEGMAALVARNGIRRAATETDPASKAAIAILLRLMGEELGYCKGVLNWMVDWAIAVSLFGKDTMAKAWAKSVAGYQLANTSEVIVASDEIVKLLQKGYDEQGGQGDQQGTSDARKQGQGRAGRQLDLNGPDANDFDRGNVILKGFESLQNSSYSIETHKYPNTGVPFCAPPQAKASYQRLKSTLMQRLQAIVEDEDDGLDERGTLAGHRLVDAKLGSRDVFADPGKPGEQLDTAISLLIDASGSMANATDGGMTVSAVCAAATWAIGNAINGYTSLGASLSLSSYNDRLLVLKDWKEPWKVGSGLTGYYPSGSTLTYQAVENRLKDLARRKEKRKILFLITDGDIGDLSSLAKSAAEGDMEIACMVIATPKQVIPPAPYLKNFSVVNPKNLAQEMLKAVIKMF